MNKLTNSKLENKTKEYLKLLNNVKTALDRKESMPEIVRKYKGSSSFYRYLRDNNIIMGTYKDVKWNSSIPITYTLANNVAKGAYLISKDYLNRKKKESKPITPKEIIKENNSQDILTTKQPVVQTPVKPVKTKVSKQREFNLFWGLLKIKY